MTGRGNVKFKIWLVLAVVFVLGTVTGAALGGLYHSRAGGRAHSGGDGDGERGPRHFDKMRKELNLSDEQATRVRAILDETGNEYRALRTELRPRFEEPRLRARAKIREVLDEEQRRKFDALAAERDAKRDERDRGR
jgi:Spy/CpxP family protein refolding chaperone